MGTQRITIATICLLSSFSLFTIKAQAENNVLGGQTVNVNLVQKQKEIQANLKKDGIGASDALFNQFRKVNSEAAAKPDAPRSQSGTATNALKSATGLAGGSGVLAAAASLDKQGESSGVTDVEMQKLFDDSAGKILEREEKSGASTTINKEVETAENLVSSEPGQQVAEQGVGEPSSVRAEVTPPSSSLPPTGSESGDSTPRGTVNPEQQVVEQKRQETIEQLQEYFVLQRQAAKIAAENRGEEIGEEELQRIARSQAVRASGHGQGEVGLDESLYTSEVFNDSLSGSQRLAVDGTTGGIPQNLVINVNIPKDPEASSAKELIAVLKEVLELPQELRGLSQSETAAIRALLADSVQAVKAEEALASNSKSRKYSDLVSGESPKSKFSETQEKELVGLLAKAEGARKPQTIRAVALDGKKIESDKKDKQRGQETVKSPLALRA